MIQGAGVERRNTTVAVMNKARVARD